MNFWSSSSCYCQSGCEMWQDCSQLCNVEMCCIWNSFLSSALLCEIRGYDWQRPGGLNHILNLLKEIYWFSANHKTLCKGLFRRSWKIHRTWNPVWGSACKRIIKSVRLGYGWQLKSRVFSRWELGGDKKTMVLDICPHRGKDSSLSLEDQTGFE